MLEALPMSMSNILQGDLMKPRLNTGTAVTEHMTVQRGQNGKEEFARQTWEDTKRRHRK